MGLLQNQMKRGLLKYYVRTIQEKDAPGEIARKARTIAERSI